MDTTVTSNISLANLDPRLHPPASTPPTPPRHLFRTVRLLSPPTSQTGVWLCFPRKLQDIQTLRCAIASYPLVRQLFARNLTTFKTKNRLMTPQLSIVKTSTDTAALRRESYALENGGQRIQTLRRVQLTGTPETSFLVFRPVFGCTVERFAKRCLEGGAAIPGWLFWHIFLGMMEGMEELHARGVAGWWGSAEDEGNVLLDLYGDEGRFRDYPDVVFIGVHDTGELEKEAVENDVRGMMAFLGKVAGTWTDGGLLGKYVRPGRDGGDALVAFEREWGKEGGGNAVALKQVKKKWWAAALRGRGIGPNQMGHELAQWIHDDLASEDELAEARKVVLAFGASVGRLRERVGSNVEQ